MHRRLNTVQHTYLAPPKGVHHLAIDRMTTKHFQSPILTIFTRRVPPKHQKQYAEWTSGINAEAAKFPGSRGATVLRSGPDQTEFHTLLQFDSPDHLEHWLDSDERAEWLERLEGITIECEEVNSLTGMERWFTLPSQAVAQAPPRYKSALLLLLGLYPVSYLMQWLASPITGAIAEPVARLLTMSMTIVVMVWAVMPALTWVFFWWLYPERRRDSAGVT